MSARFPHELIDRIIDNLHDDLPTLRNVALVGRSCAPRTRVHLFHNVTIHKPQHLSVIDAILRRSPELCAVVRELKVASTPEVSLDDVLSTSLGRLPHLDALSLNQTRTVLSPDSECQLIRLCANLRSLELKSVPLTRWDDLRLLLVSPSLLMVRAREILGPETLPDEYKEPQVDVIMPSKVSVLHGYMSNLLWKCLHRPMMQGLDVEMCTSRERHRWIYLRVLSISEHNKPRTWCFTFDEETDVEDAREAASQIVNPNQCGMIRVVLRCREASWLPVFFSCARVSGLRALGLICLRTEVFEADWSWQALDAILSDKTRWPYLTCIQFVAPHGIHMPRAPLPLFTANGGSLKKSRLAENQLALFLGDVVSNGDAS